MKEKEELYNNVEPSNDFDWDFYENGATGGNNLVVNKKVMIKNLNDKVYCHEGYAQELYERMFSYEIGNNVKYVPKDSIVGTTYNVVSIHPCSKTEITVDSDCGMSSVIDMNKEKQYLDAIGCKSVQQFMDALRYAEDFEKTLIDTNLIATVCEGGRISLWEGHKSKIEKSLIDQIKDPENCRYAYKAKIKDVNNGGYFVDICGVRCFMPGSLAAAGVITDYESMIGKTVPVMAVNYLPKSGFVVSYKQYMNAIMPTKIQNEISVGMEVMAKVTGETKKRNGLFVIFKDSNGEWFFSGLVHRSSMSKDFERSFDRRDIKIGDEMRLYVSGINEYSNGNYRIVLTDSPKMIQKTEKEEENGKQ